MRFRRLVSPLWLALVVLATGCETTPVQPDPVTINLAGNAGAANVFTSHTFTSDRRGIATVTLRWTTGDLDFFATVAACNTDPFTCGTRVQSQAEGTTTETLTFGVTEGEVMRLWVRNFSAPAGHPYTIEVLLE
jgi:hypothetical protein